MLHTCFCHPGCRKNEADNDVIEFWCQTAKEGELTQETTMALTQTVDVEGEGGESVLTDLMGQHDSMTSFSNSDLKTIGSGVAKKEQADTDKSDTVI
jgi:hypothetical protein